MDHCTEYLVSFVSFLFRGQVHCLFLTVENLIWVIFYFGQLRLWENLMRNIILGGGGGYTESLADSQILVYVQTLHNDCLHIEDVHHLFCTHFIIFYVQRFSESRSSSGSTLSFCLTTTILGCLVCVICNSNIYSNFA